MERPNIQRLLEFQEFMHKFRDVKRSVRFAGTEEQENDAEHSYSLAMTAWYIAPYINPPLNIDKLLRYALVHDVVKVYAGDTFAFDAESVVTKKAREAAALERIKTEWADFPDLIQTIEEYDQKTDRESKFVYALDKLMPVFLNYLDGGRDYAEQNITYQALYDNDYPKVYLSEEMRPYFDELHELLRTQPELFHQPE